MQKDWSIFLHGPFVDSLIKHDDFPLLLGRLPGGNTNSLRLHELNELHCYTTFVCCHARAMNPAATSPILQIAASTVSPESQGPKGPRAGGSLESFVSKSQILQHLGEELLVILCYFMASCGSKSEN